MNDNGRTLIMGILNCTPDSFSDGGLYLDSKAATDHALEMIGMGADIIDIGGESTKPGFTPVDEEEEIRRVIPVITGLRDTGVVMSVDTTKPGVAKKAAEAGANIINDISGDLKGNMIADVASANGSYLVIMFNCRKNGGSEGSIISRALDEIRHNIDIALGKGISESRLIIDPGIGFGTSREQDIELTKNIASFSMGGKFRVLYAASRKRMIKELMATLAAEGDIDDVTDTVNIFAASHGADIIRTHRVKELREKLAVTDRLTGKV